MEADVIYQQFQREIQAAEEARRAGLEGRARVCARRAAGAALKRIYPAGPALDLIEMAAADEARFSPEIRQAAGRLLERVDANYSLPVGVDVLEDARLIAKEIFEV